MFFINTWQLDYNQLYLQWSIFEYIFIFKMILQLPNGRIIELSVEQYLDLNYQDLRELNSLGAAYTSECTNPFYGLYSDKSQDFEDITEDDEFYLTDDHLDTLDNGIDGHLFPDEGDIF